MQTKIIDPKQYFWQAIASAIGGLFGMGAQSSANAQNMEIARYNNEWNEKMWHMQNEYNSPKNQMARYMEAGLNPNLVAGNPGNSTSVPTASTPHVEPLTNGQFIADGISKAMDYIQRDKVADSEVDKNESIKNYNEAAAENQRASAALSRLKGIKQGYENDKESFRKPFYQTLINNEISRSTSKATASKQSVEWFDVTYDKRLKKLISEAENLVKQGQKIGGVKIA